MVERCLKLFAEQRFDELLEHVPDAVIDRCLQRRTNR